MIRLRITGMTCDHCAITVKSALERVEGVQEAKVYFPQGFAEIKTSGEVDLSRLTDAVKKAGYGAEPLEEGPEVYIPKEGIYDLFVMGGGSAGFAGAIKASDLGARVLVVEKGVIGGTCLNRGCIPSKFLIETAKEVLCKGDGVDIGEVISREQDMITQLRKEKYWDVLDAYPSIEYREGRGSFKSKDKAVVDGEEITFHRALITTGSRPSLPPVKNIENVRHYTSDTIFSIDHLPEHLIILGGGAIGLELGQAFRRFGSRVTILEALEDIVINEEPELRERLRKILEDEGIEIITGALVEEVREENGIIEVFANKKGDVFSLKGSDLLVATGRVPNTEGIGLEEVGVATNKRGFIEVNDYLQTSVAEIYSAGDCAGRMMLVTVSAMEGSIAAENALLGNRRKTDYLSVPHAVFTDPELASVGYTETKARERNLEIETRVLEFSKVPRAILSGRTEGIVKIVAEEGSGRILGVHVLGDHGGEIIHKAVPLIKYSLTVNDLIEMIDVYPTLSESVKLCAQSFKKDVSKLSCCAQ